MAAEVVTRFCMLAISVTGLSDQFPALCRRQGNNKASGPLSFSNDGTFKISIFEDLHFGENAWEAWGPAADIKTVKVINKVLDNAKPDLVVLNGDLITGDNAYLENATFVLDQLVKPMLDRGLPWASTYGNHDYQLNVTGSDIPSPPMIGLDREDKERMLSVVSVHSWAFVPQGASRISVSQIVSQKIPRP
ncbi:Metallo-dependent phosphatase-like protein [Colletotrichum cereale]|nr:Metallo-dependent phosphatase-like protein [Colletotrichum cereale]